MITEGLVGGVVAVLVLLLIPVVAAVIAACFTHAIRLRRWVRDVAPTGGASEIRAVRRDVAAMRGRTLLDDIEDLERRS